MPNKICVYTICKNESKFVTKWYNSMKEADSIVVLDTGSTDDTVPMLRALGVTVAVKEIKPWRFDVARNESLKLVPEDCNILVCTDLDEVFESGWADKLRAAWTPTTQRCEYLYAWSHTDSGKEGRVFCYNKIHSRNWYWAYPVHELLKSYDTNTEHYSSEVAIQLYDIKLHHYPDPEKSRGSYLPLLELRKSESPNDWYGRIYLAHEYRYRGFYDKCIEELTDILTNYSGQYTITERASCHLFLADCYKEKGDYDKAIEEYKLTIEADITYREGYLGLASVYVILKQYEFAIVYIKQGLRNSVRHFTWLERDNSWSWEPYDMLSICYFYTGRKLEALACSVKALSFDEGDERLRNNLQACLNNTEDSVYC